MRCHEVRHKLEAFHSTGVVPEDIDEVKKHLRTCPSCAADQDAWQTLRRMLAAAQADDETEIISLAAQRTRVRARAAEGSGSSPIVGVWSFYLRLATNPTTAVGLSMAIIFLTIITLVPFEFDHTIGYEVAVAGVDPDLVDEEHRICDLLYDLGLNDADVDFQGCNVTCSLLIIDLKTHEEAQRVIAAFHRINDDGLQTQVIAVRASESTTLLGRANKTLLQ